MKREISFKSQLSCYLEGSGVQGFIQIIYRDLFLCEGKGSGKSLNKLGKTGVLDSWVRARVSKPSK